MLARGRKWLLVYLIALYALFNACKDVTMQRAARQTVHRPRVLAQRQDRYILRQHLQDTATQTVRQTIGIYRRPVSDDTFCRRFADHNRKCRRLARVISLHQDIVRRNAFSGIQFDGIGGINVGVKSSFLTKADFEISR